MASPAAAIPAGVYRGRACGLPAIQRYEAFLGRPVGYVLDFMIEAPTWQQFEAGALTSTADVSAWAPQLYGRTLALGVPACVQGTSWADEAAGHNDTRWQALGARLVALGLAQAVLRIGREFNASWYPWAVKEGGQAAYKAGYAHVVSVLRGVPGARFRFCWNPILGTGQLSTSGTESCYPGDAVVDEIGLDVYDGDWAGIYPYATADRVTTAGQQRVWDIMLTEWDSLRGWHSLALSHGKPLSFPEWGLRLWKDNGTYRGGGDNAVLVEGMAAFIAGCGASWMGFWEDPAQGGMGVSDPDGPGRTPVPMARAAFLAAFGGAA